MRKFAPYAVEAEKAGKKIYHLNIGQPDIATPPAYFDAVKQFSQSVLAYAPSAGVPEMLEAVAGYYNKIGAPITTKDILVSTGGSEALQMLMACILDDGDEIIVPEPFYPNYNTFIRLTGASVHPITTTPEEGYKFAIRERVEACINEHTRAILFTNPGNPTGTVLTREEMKLMADIAKEHNLFVIGDEVYREFVYGGEPLMSLLQLEGYEDNVVVIDSVSKRFSACGARIGCVISRNKELMAQAMKWCQGRLCASTIDQVASARLYTVGPEYFAAVRDEYRDRRDALVAGLKKIPGVVYSEPKGAFYVMAALPVDDADKFQKWLLTDFDDHGDTVMFAPAESFYETPHRGVNEIRMAYVIKKPDLERAMESGQCQVSVLYPACLATQPVQTPMGPTRPQVPMPEDTGSPFISSLKRQVDMGPVMAEVTMAGIQIRGCGRCCPFAAWRCPVPGTPCRPSRFPEGHHGEAHHVCAAAGHGRAACKTGETEGRADGRGGYGQRQHDAHHHADQNAHQEGLQLRSPHDKVADGDWPPCPMGAAMRYASPTPTSMVTMGVTRMSIFVSLETALPNSEAMMATNSTPAGRRRRPGRWWRSPR
jgi:aspartate aminotransferase